MKVIFLDIDGVLNSHQYLLRTDTGDRGIYTDIDPQKVDLLKQLVDATDAKIVLSSSWRVLFTDTLQPTEYSALCLCEAPKEQGLSQYSKIGELHEERGDEIRQWLSEHDDVTAFVILDDDHFNWNALQPNWVKASYYIGLTYIDYHSSKGFAPYLIYPHRFCLTTNKTTL